MPRRNAPRTVLDEANVARRVALERARRGWSYDGLAERMKQAGYPIRASALHRIETAQPARRITVDELVGFSRVFEVDLKDMLTPPAMVASPLVVEQLEEWSAALDDRHHAERRIARAWQRVRELARLEPSAVEAAEEYLKTWAASLVAERRSDPDAADQDVDHLLRRLRGEPSLVEELLGTVTGKTGK